MPDQSTSLRSAPAQRVALGWLSDDALLARLTSLLSDSRRVESDLVAHIGEVDVRRLYRREAAPSMFVYCTDALHLSEHEAYLRITVARAARDHPVLLEWLGGGRLTLSGIAKLAPVLTRGNRDAVLRRASHRSKREIEELVAELSPRSDAATSIRKLPQPAPGLEHPQHTTHESNTGPPASPAPVASPPSIAVDNAPPTCIPRLSTLVPTSPERYKLQLTIDPSFRDTLERLRALLPNEDVVEIVARALSERLERLETRRFGSPRSRTDPDAADPDAADPDAADPDAADPRPSSRHIPAALRRAVYDRDGGRCRFTNRRGERCRARERLEFHHLRPWAVGGAHSIGNIRLMCRAHNALLAEHDFGAKRMARFRRGSPEAPAREIEPP